MESCDSGFSRQWGQRQFLYFPRRLERVSSLRGTEVHQHPFNDAPHWKVSPQASQVEGCLELENKASTFLSMAGVNRFSLEPNFQNISPKQLQSS